MDFNNKIMQKFAPKKSIGQHFLHDKNISKKIVELLNTIDGDTIIEIGPGTGALTQFLVEKDIKLIAYEIDKRSVEYLNNEFKIIIPKKLQIYENDFLTSDLSKLTSSSSSRIKVIGNIPYYITSPILFHLCEFSDVVDSAVLMMQKEIYQRLVARPKTKEYGILSLLANLFFKVEDKFDVPPSCFFPPPKVMSTVVKISFVKNNLNIEIQDKFKILNLIKVLFNHRRKIINNTIKNYFSQINYNQDEIVHNTHYIKYSKMRPEELSIQDYLILYEIINQKPKTSDEIRIIS